MTPWELAPEHDSMLALRLPPAWNHLPNSDFPFSCSLPLSNFSFESLGVLRVFGQGSSLRNARSFEILAPRVLVYNQIDPAISPFNCVCFFRERLSSVDNERLYDFLSERYQATSAIIE